MMSYKIRASSASHRFGNLSNLSARQFHLIELRKCLSTTALHYISVAACMKPRSQIYFENILDIFSNLCSRRLPRAQFVKHCFNQFLSRWIQKFRSPCTYSVINIDLSLIPYICIPFVTDCIELFPNNKFSASLFALQSHFVWPYMSKVNALVLLQKYRLYLGMGRKHF